MPKLTEKQKRFCEEYLIDLNATQAAERAGYKNREIGRQLITKNNVLEYLNMLREQQSKRTEITADMVLRELAAIAFSDRTELAKIDSDGIVIFTPTDQLSPEIKKAIAGIKEGKFGTEVSSYDKVRALELLGKHLGIFDKRDDNADTLAKLDEVLAKIGGDP
ncbi:MAG: terminase small subunit [Ruminococcus sp.]|nr:terminase small subunit [Ruminococcus sp.]